jgi:hypothetical protein
MPYVRCGKCVYKGKKCNTKGKKVGCSDSIEKAKKYLIKLRMETAGEANENTMKITKETLIQIIKEEVELILTNEEVKEMFDVNVGDQVELSEADAKAATAAMPALERVPTVAEPAIQRPDKQNQKLLKLLVDFVSDLEKRVEALEAIAGPPAG